MRSMRPQETARTVMFVIPVLRLTGSLEEQRQTLAANLRDRAQVKRWAFILHDGDDAAASSSEPSGPHWQGVLHTAKDLPASRFASWLPGCEPVRKMDGGHNALLDGVLYLTHELQPDKAQYSRSALSSSPGWDWEAELRDREVRSAAGGEGRGRKGRTKVMAAVLDGDLSALEARRRGISNERAVRIARHQFLAGLGSEDLPPVRVNFYLRLPSTQDPGGQRLAEALGRTLSADQRVYRVLGASIDDYDGEDVLVMSSRLDGWGDRFMGEFVDWRRAGSLGGAHELLAVLGATPRAHSLPTKYGPTQLVHRHTVIVGTEPIEDFIGVLEQAYRQVLNADAKEQSFLSVPVFVPVTAEDFAVQASSRFVLGRGELGQYVEVGRVRFQMDKALSRARHVPLHERTQLVRQIEQRQTLPICSIGERVAKSLCDDQAVTADDVLNEFADLGQSKKTSGGDLW